MNVALATLLVDSLQEVTLPRILAFAACTSNEQPLHGLVEHVRDMEGLCHRKV